VNAGILFSGILKINWMDGPRTDLRRMVMKRKLLVVLALAVGLVVVVSPLFAHHGLAPYDKDHPVTLTGTVTEFDFVNPHVRVRFEVKDANGGVTTWVAESAPPQKMYRAGWNRLSLKPGDVITVTGYALKDGKKVIAIKKLVPANGGLVLSEGAD
jgi:uncharacterized protein DUF6152